MKPNKLVTIDELELDKPLIFVKSTTGEIDQIIISKKHTKIIKETEEYILLSVNKSNL